MAKLFNRAKMTTSTTGAGTVTLGSASIGFQSFANAGVSDGDVVQYVIEEGSNFEIGTGTYTASGTTLTRTPTESTNSNNAISLGGAATVSVTAIDTDFNVLQHEGVTKVAPTSTGATVTGTLAATALTGDGSALTGIVSIPTGVIVMWSGAISAIPSGWVLCDGNNSTPNLTDRFVIHADADSSGTRNVGDTGGAHSVTVAEANLPSHTHSSGNLATNAGGDHSHNFNANTGNSGNHSHNGSTSNTGSHSHNTNGLAWRYWAYSQGTNLIQNYTNNQLIAGATTSNTGGHYHNFGTSGAGDHSHNFNANTGNSGNHNHGIGGSSGATGSGSSLTTIPKFYALAFIMKT
tara:strand:- start:1059 stop:2105 length:1047 start_codon:yes stop_codon:yes gene_type:complete